MVTTQKLLSNIKVLFATLLTITLLSSCHVGRTIFWNFAAYDDYDKFSQLDISASDDSPTFRFKKIENISTLINDSLRSTILQGNDFETFLTDNHTTSFFVLRQDTILYENYFNGYKAGELHSIYSVSKSFISLLIGIAMEEGKIHSLDDPIKKYIPALKDKAIANVTIQELIDMESGIKFSELYYNPFGDLAKYFYGRSLKKYMAKSKLKNEPKGFDYVSVNTDLLGWVLESATQQSVAQYLQEKVWQPLEMKHNASWSLDSKQHGTPKFSFGLNARTSDLIKLGYLYINDGTYQGKKIINPEWVNRIDEVQPNQLNQANYKNHWWREIEYTNQLDSNQQDRILDTYITKDERGQENKSYKIYTGNYYAAGFLGQFVYVNPANNMVIVRTGKKQGKTDWIYLFRMIAENLGSR